jgi:hypothetical protein
MASNGTTRKRRTPGREDSFPASDPVSVVSTLIAGRAKKLVGTDEVIRAMRDAEKQDRFA